MEKENVIGEPSGSNERRTVNLNDNVASDSSDSGDADEEFSDEEEYCDQLVCLEIYRSDEVTLLSFVRTNAAPVKTLADIIAEKLAEKRSGIKYQPLENDPVCLEELKPSVVALYEGTRDVLMKYRSGKLPRALEMIPNLTNWEQILHLTDPPKWSEAAMYQVTRLFLSTMNENMVQRFFNLVLLPRIRDDLAENEKLNLHLYRAICTTLHRSTDFLKGFVIPLLESGTCTLREAVVIGSVLVKAKIPMLQSSDVLIKIAEMDYSGPNSIFLRTLLEKRYGVSYRALNAMVSHYLRFKNESRQLPVVWHQSLFAFVLYYKHYITHDQRKALMELLSSQSHPSITPQIRMQLQYALSKDLEDPQPDPEPTVDD